MRPNTLDNYRAAVEHAMNIGDATAAYVYARMAARHVFVNLGSYATGVTWQAMTRRYRPTFYAHAGEHYTRQHGSRAMVANGGIWSNYWMQDATR